MVVLIALGVLSMISTWTTSTLIESLLREIRLLRQQLKPLLERTGDTDEQSRD